MRILKLFSAAFLLSLFFSCSNPAQVSSVRTAETLRTVSDSMAQNVVWSEELQGDFLKQKITGADGVSKSVKTTPYSAAVSSDRQKYPPLPPYIRGFVFRKLGFGHKRLFFERNGKRHIVVPQILKNKFPFNSRKFFFLIHNFPCKISVINGCLKCP